MKKTNRLLQLCTGSLAVFAAAVMLLPLQASAYPGKVTASSANIRSEADPESSSIGGYLNGEEIDILGQKEGTDGSTWYEVSFEGKKGYIRGDLVSTSGSAASSSSASSSSSSSSASSSSAASSSQSNAASSFTSVENRAGYISAQRSVNVRASAGTNTSDTVVDGIPSGTNVTVIGETNGNDGQKWYRIRYSGGKEGYVRADMVKDGEAPLSSANSASSASQTEAGTGTQAAEAGGAAAGNAAGEGGAAEGAEGAAEGEGAEGEGAGETAPETEVQTAVPQADAQQPAEVMGQQYTVSYELNESGEEVAWLNDHNSAAGNHWQVERLLESYNEVTRLQNVERTNNFLRILAMVLGVLAVAFLGFAIYSRISLDRYMEAEYEDEDEVYEDEEIEPRESTARAAAMPARPSVFRRHAPDEEASYEDEDDEDEDDEEYDEDGRGGFRGIFAKLRGRRDEYDEDEEDDEEDEDEEDDVPPPPPAIRRTYTPNNTPEAAAARQKPRNFMAADDDEFEYEFLNMDEDKVRRS